MDDHTSNHRHCHFVGHSTEIQSIELQHLESPNRTSTSQLQQRSPYAPVRQVQIAEEGDCRRACT